jgi:hypothetical protein
MHFDPSLLEMIASTTKNGGRIVIEGTRIEIYSSENQKDSEAPKASTESEGFQASRKPTDAIEVRSARNAFLRGYILSQLTKDQQKIAKAMQICASEGWHLWEMQFSLYCAEHLLNPAYTSVPSYQTLRAGFDPMSFRFTFVRAALKEYARTKRASVIAKLDSI